LGHSGKKLSIVDGAAVVCVEESESALQPASFHGIVRKARLLVKLLSQSLLKAV
jgi:hypothetical protein